MTKIYPDWVAGMFMLFRKDFFKNINGFDQGYFLYYEDIDLCIRARKQKFEVVFVNSTFVYHDARRSSHKNLRFLIIHITSVVRFFSKHLFRFPPRDQTQ